MFLIELTNGNLLFGLVSEPAAVMILGISMIGAAISVRRFLKYQTARKNYGRVEDYTQG